MSANLEAKKLIVEEIKEKISKSKSITFVDYRGLSVEKDTKLRQNFKSQGAEYKVYKNRLMLRALTECGIQVDQTMFEGTTAVAFSYNDEVAAPKIVMESVEKDKVLSVKFGIVDGKVVDAEEVKALSKLPSKEVLIAQLLSMLNAPATSLANVLIAPTRGLVIALDQIATK